MAEHIFVLDASAMLSDPWAHTRYGEAAVVVPLAVIDRLHRMWADLELGWFARTALGELDRLGTEHGRLDRPVPLATGGTVRVDPGGGSPDERIAAVVGADPAGAAALACALGRADLGAVVTVVSDSPALRIAAAALGLAAQRPRPVPAADSGWTGMAALEVTDAEIAALTAGEPAAVPAAAHLPVHTGVELTGPGASALGRVRPGGTVAAVAEDRAAFGLQARSARQALALDLLLDEQVGIVSLGGKAGTGKSALALCAGLESVLELGRYRRVVVFRPLYPVGGQELGYLPGGEGEKMNPWAQAVFDTLEHLAEPHTVQEIIDRELLEVLPLTHIRGRSLHESFVIVDEAQSLDRTVLLTVLSRLGAGSKVVLTHDVDQRDNVGVGRHDGVAAVVDKLTGHDLFAHVTLVRSERSAIAELVTEVLADFTAGP